MVDSRKLSFFISIYTNKKCLNPLNCCRREKNHMPKNVPKPPTLSPFEMFNCSSIQTVRRQTAQAKKWGRLLCCGGALVLMSPWLGAQTSTGATSPATTPNLLVEAARSIGATQCLPAIERISALAITGSRAHEVLVDWDRKQPSTAPLFSLIGIDFQNSIAAASITAVPQVGGECVLAAERISMAPYTCKSIAQVELKGYRATTLLPIFTVYTSPGDPGASVSLIDSPPSCLIVRRHVQYGSRETVPTAIRAP